MLNRLRLVVVLAVATTLAAVSTGCVNKARDRCYLDMPRYRAMKEVFVETGSMQRVEQIMQEEQWRTCERNQFRYMLTRDLYLDDLEQQLNYPPTGAGVANR